MKRVLIICLLASGFSAFGFGGGADADDLSDARRQEAHILSMITSIQGGSKSPAKREKSLCLKAIAAEAEREMQATSDIERKMNIGAAAIKKGEKTQQLIFQALPHAQNIAAALEAEKAVQQANARRHTNNQTTCSTVLAVGVSMAVVTLAKWLNKK